MMLRQIAYFCGMNWFSFFKRTQDVEPMKKYLIAGLGNIGPEYVNTRHNIGFKAVDYLAAQEQAEFSTVRLGALAQFRHKGRAFFLLKPNTYMNLSGKAISYWMEKENIPVENVLVITDDLNLPFGTIRIKPKGSDGGHNGLKSIQQMLGHSNYPRLRFGISDEFKKGQQVNYVLGEWSDEERQNLPEHLETMAQAVRSFGTAGLELTMSGFNGTRGGSRTETK